MPQVQETEESEGSPPLTQDKFSVGTVKNRAYGITPAYAGQIDSSLVALVINWDHPRLRGTNRF